MRIQEYISSGIIESYVLGLASEQERKEFERLSLLFPELAEAKLAFELNLEKEALANAITPPSFLKNEIMDRIKVEAMTGNFENPASEKINRAAKNIRGMRWAIAASVLLVLACSVFIYFMHQKGQYYEQEMAKSKKAIEKLEEKSFELEERMKRDNSHIKEVKLINPQNNIPATINVFWDSTSQHVYLIINDLRPLPAGQSYQVWSVTKGKYKGLGLFDAPANEERLILRVNNAQDAESFAITIEKNNTSTQNAP